MPLPLLAIAGLAAAGATAGGVIAHNNDQPWWQGALIGGGLGAGAGFGLSALGVGGAGGWGALGSIPGIGTVGRGLSGLGSMITRGGTGLLNLGKAIWPQTPVAPTTIEGMPIGAGMIPGVGDVLGAATPLPATTEAGSVIPAVAGQVLTPEEQALEAETIAAEQARDAAQAAAESAQASQTGSDWLSTETRKKLFDLVDQMFQADVEGQKEQARQQIMRGGGQMFQPGVVPVGGMPLAGLTQLPITQRMLTGPLNF